MICEMCEMLGGFEGDPPAEADFLLTVTAPPAEAEANAPEFLCTNHAQQGAEAYLGFGWAITCEFAGATVAAPFGRISTLIDPGTNTAITGG